MTPEATAVESVTLLAADGVAAVCQVKTVPAGLFVAVMVLKLTVVIGQTLVFVVAVKVGADVPTAQGIKTA